MPGGLQYRSPATVDNGQQNITQEIRLQSTDPAAHLVWTAGLFGNVNRQSYLEQIHDPMLNQLTEAVLGAPYTDVFCYLDADGNCTGPDAYDPRFPFDSYFLKTNSKDEQEAVFGELTYSFTDRFKATVGARWSHMKYSFDTLTGGPQLYAPPRTGTGNIDENAFTPKVSLQFQMDQDNLFYATYAKGFRPGGANNPIPNAACPTDFANFGINTDPATFSSDSVKSYEVGAKNNFNNRVRIASSIYYIQWNNIQQLIVPPVCQISFIANTGNADVKGIDFQADISVTEQPEPGTGRRLHRRPLHRGLSFRAALHPDDAGQRAVRPEPAAAGQGRRLDRRQLERDGWRPAAGAVDGVHRCRVPLQRRRARVVRAHGRRVRGTRQVGDREPGSEQLAV